ncbi:MAG: hypothetical protein V3V55_02655 [Rhodospirillales bacterium]
MYVDTIDHFANVAAKKAGVPRKNPASFFVGSMMAGACTGLGIALTLTLVVFAGSELFTGHTMLVTLGKPDGLKGIGEGIKSTSGKIGDAAKKAGAVIDSIGEKAEKISERIGETIDSIERRMRR